MNAATTAESRLDCTAKGDAFARCPLCTSEYNKPIGEREVVKLRRCSSCHLIFHRELRNDAEIREYYDNYYNAENLAFSPITEARFKELIVSFEEYRKSNRILDVGCGGGHLLKVARDGAWCAYGTDLAAGAIDQVAGLGINGFCGELNAAAYATQFFDVIYCSEVIEHVLDPLGLLTEIARILRSGGLLYLTTPNYDSLSRRLLGYKWRNIAIEHINYFSPGTLSRALVDVGFSKAKVSTCNIDPYEFKKMFARATGDGMGGFQIERTERLREHLESNAALGIAKHAVNRLLRATAMGDTIVARVEK